MEKTIYVSRVLRSEPAGYGHRKIFLSLYTSENMFYWQRYGCTFTSDVWEEYQKLSDTEYLYDENGNILEDRELELSRLIDNVVNEITEYHGIEWDWSVYVD